MIEIDVDKYPTLTAMYGISRVPTFIKVGDTVPDSAGEAQALKSRTGLQTLKQLEAFAEQQ